MLAILYALILIVLAMVGWLGFGLVRRWLFARRVDRARTSFARRRQTLEQLFFDAAATSGKPRGLAWKQCDFQDGLLLARDRANGELIGLVGVTISFEAIPGGGMEEVEAVGNLRAGTAVFTFRRDWATQGRVVFNLEPPEVIERYRQNLVAIDSTRQLVRNEISRS